MQMTFVHSSTISDLRVNHENCLSLDRTVTFTPLRSANYSNKTYSIAFAQKQTFFPSSRDIFSYSQETDQY